MRKTFTPEYREILELALEQGEYLVETSPQEARNLRSYFYHYRKHLKETDDPLVEKVRELKFSITPKGLVIFKPLTPGTNILRANLSK